MSVPKSFVDLVAGHESMPLAPEWMTISGQRFCDNEACPCFHHPYRVQTLTRWGDEVASYEYVLEVNGVPVHLRLCSACLSVGWPLLPSKHPEPFCDNPVCALHMHVPHGEKVVVSCGIPLSVLSDSGIHPGNVPTMAVGRHLYASNYVPLFMHLCDACAGAFEIKQLGNHV